MMSERIYLNNDWKFAEQFEASMTEAAYDDSTMQNVRLPHTCKETPLHYFDEHCYQMISGYRRVIEAEKAWEGKKILLTIDGAAHEPIDRHLLHLVTF
jgi:beta-galactosidase